MYLYTRHAGHLKNRHFILHDGKFCIEEDNYKEVVCVVNNRISAVKWKRGDDKEETIYGKSLKRWAKGKLVESYTYRPGRLTSLHGKAFSKSTKLNYISGTRYMKYYRGGLIAERFVYANKQEAYNITKGSRKDVVIKHPNGKVGVEVGFLTPKSGVSFAWKSQLFGDILDVDYVVRTLKRGIDTKYSILIKGMTGVVAYKGIYENDNFVGEWIVNKEKKWYMEGSEVPFKVFSTPLAELEPEDLLSISNVQLKSNLLQRYGYEKFFAKMGERAVKVHAEGDMELYDIQTAGPQPVGITPQADIAIKLLKVKCPSTGQNYVLRVPPESTTCEQARQWTFNLPLTTPPEEYIHFEQEA